MFQLQMMIYECLMLMLMLCKSSYARLTPEVLQHSRGFTGACVAVAQAWCAWLVWIRRGHTAWHMRWLWTHGRGQERTLLAWD